LAVTLDNLGRTDWDVINDGGFGGFFWFVTLWWVNSLSRTSDTVGWVDVTDFTFFFTRWTRGSTVFIESDFTFTNWGFNSGVVGTSDTGFEGGTSFTLDGTWRTLLSVEVFTVFTNTRWWVDSSLGTSDTVISSFVTSGTFSGTRWTMHGTGIIVTSWAFTSWGRDSVTSTDITMIWFIGTGGTGDGTSNTGWLIARGITKVVSSRSTHFGGS